MKLRQLTETAAAALLLLGAGCITHDETVSRDEPRVKVEFENDAAARQFYETLHARAGDGPRTESSTEVEIPILFRHKQRVVDGENRHFNAAVRRCDTNGDGRITEAEARIYADNR